MAEEQAQQTISNPNVTVESAKPAAAAPAGTEAATAASKAYNPSGQPGGYYWGTGRRKTSVARVRIRPGTGKISINDREMDDFFHEPKDREAVVSPLNATGVAGKLDVLAKVSGGGFTGQAGAIKLGLARALLSLDADLLPPLRDGGYLTRDSRMKERKKYGQKGARRRFQFSKR